MFWPFSSPPKWLTRIPISPPIPGFWSLQCLSFGACPVLVLWRESDYSTVYSCQRHSEPVVIVTGRVSEFSAGTGTLLGLYKSPQLSGPEFWREMFCFSPMPFPQSKKKRQKLCVCMPAQGRSQVVRWLTRLRKRKKVNKCNRSCESPDLCSGTRHPTHSDWEYWLMPAHSSTSEEVPTSLQVTLLKDATLLGKSQRPISGRHGKMKLVFPDFIWDNAKGLSQSRDPWDWLTLGCNYFFLIQLLLSIPAFPHFPQKPSISESLPRDWSVANSNRETLLLNIAALH